MFGIFFNRKNFISKVIYGFFNKILFYNPFIRYLIVIIKTKLKNNSMLLSLTPDWDNIDITSFWSQDQPSLNTQNILLSCFEVQPPKMNTIRANNNTHFFSTYFQASSLLIRSAITQFLPNNTLALTCPVSKKAIALLSHSHPLVKNYLPYFQPARETISPTAETERPNDVANDLMLR